MDELVDGRLRTAGGGGRKWGTAHGLKRPEGALLGRDGVFGGGRRGGRGAPLGSVLDPRGEGRYVGVVEFLAGRHFDALVGVLDGADEEAVIGVAGYDGGSGIATFEDVLAGVELEATHLGVGVASVAVLRQHGAHVHLEEFGTAGGGGVERGAGEHN